MEKSTDIAPGIRRLSEYTERASVISPELYLDYNVQRGLRDKNGKGVLVGITNISEVNGMRTEDGKSVPIPGELFYRGYDIHDLINGLSHDDHFGFEQTAYLLLFGKLPDRIELNNFINILAEQRVLPTYFVRDVIMKRTSIDMMNALARSVLTLYSYDDHPDDTSLPNVLRQCITLIAQFPLLSVYGYKAYRHYYKYDSLIIHNPRKDYSTAENILHCLRDDNFFTPLEAKLLDVALILHMEHGGGNNSTFTTRLVTSTGTDTYSAIAAALGSLKGPRHGGANMKVVDMFEDLKGHVRNYEDEDEIRAYLNAILDKEAFDHKGLIYGMGHAVYTLSDPRAELLKSYVKELSKEKGCEEDFHLHEIVEKLAPGLMMEKRNIKKPICANVDFYSGFAYQMLGLPFELYTPIFAIARIAGWSAHRLEELAINNKIMRPAYMTVTKHHDYVPIDKR